MQLQRSENENLKETSNILVSEDKMCAFPPKIELWINKLKDGNLSRFAALDGFIDSINHFEENSTITSVIHKSIIAHFKALISEFTHYFPEYGVEETNPIRKMVLNPFHVEETLISDDVQEELIELQNDSNCKDNFSSQKLEEFWCKTVFLFKAMQA